MQAGSLLVVVYSQHTESQPALKVHLCLMVVLSELPENTWPGPQVYLMLSWHINNVTKSILVAIATLEIASHGKES